MRTQLLPKVFAWMFLGLIITFFTGYVVTLNETLLNGIWDGNFWIILVIIELIMIILIHSMIKKVGYTAGILLFIIYSIITGLTFSMIFIKFDVKSIMFVFLVTSVLFGIMSLLGTKINFNKFSNYLIIILLGALIIGIVNLLILNNPIIDTVISIAFIGIFLISTATEVSSFLNDDYYIKLPENNAVLKCALSLYVDFLIVFSKLIRQLKK